MTATAHGHGHGQPHQEANGRAKGASVGPGTSLGRGLCRPRPLSQTPLWGIHPLNHGVPVLPWRHSVMSTGRTCRLNPWRQGGSSVERNRALQRGSFDLWTWTHFLCMESQSGYVCSPLKNVLKFVFLCHLCLQRRMSGSLGSVRISDNNRIGIWGRNNNKNNECGDSVATTRC